MRMLDKFREKVKNDGNTVDFFADLNSLKYVASQTFSNAIDYADDNAGWVRYRDLVDIINEEAEGRNKANVELGEHQQKMLETVKEMFTQLGNRITDLENETYVKAWNPERETEYGLFRIPIPEFDWAAFREGLVNAFCHRDYTMLGSVRVLIVEEGITFSNPGGFIDGVNLKIFLQ